MGRRGAFRGPTVDVTLRMATEMLERIERLRPDDYSRSRWLREILRTGLMVLQNREATHRSDAPARAHS